MRVRKRFGQNFLVDDNIVRRILETIALGKDDHVLEIGPGRGALTAALQESAGRLCLVEIDRDLSAQLRVRFGESVELHEADILKTDISAFYQGESLRIVGNLPYNISTPLLFKLFDQQDVIRDMHFMLQEEVVDRLSACVSTRDYGRLSVMAQYACHIEKCFRVPPNAFQPVPGVNSAIVRLVPHLSPPCQVADRRNLAKLVTQAFSKRRKTARNALKGLIEAEQFERLGIDPTLRPENLTLKDFACLANELEPGGM